MIYFPVWILYVDSVNYTEILTGEKEKLFGGICKKLYIEFLGGKSECAGYSQPRSAAFLLAEPRIELESCACFTNTLPVSYIPSPIFPHILDQNIFSSKAS